jgi:hypothetical protein
MARSSHGLVRGDTDIFQITLMDGIAGRKNNLCDDATTLEVKFCNEYDALVGLE